MHKELIPKSLILLYAYYCYCRLANYSSVLVLIVYVFSSHIQTTLVFFKLFCSYSGTTNRNSGNFFTRKTKFNRMNAVILVLKMESLPIDWMIRIISRKQCIYPGASDSIIAVKIQSEASRELVLALSLVLIFHPIASNFHIVPYTLYTEKNYKSVPNEIEFAVAKNNCLIEATYSVRWRDEQCSLALTLFTKQNIIYTIINLEKFSKKSYRSFAGTNFASHHTFT